MKIRRLTTAKGEDGDGGGGGGEYGVFTHLLSGGGGGRWKGGELPLQSYKQIAKQPKCLPQLLRYARVCVF